MKHTALSFRDIFQHWSVGVRISADHVVLVSDEQTDDKTGKKKDKNIQQRVFASGHPPNY